MNEAEIKNKMLSLEEKIFAEKLPEEMEIWNNKLLITYSKKLKDIKVLDLKKLGIDIEESDSVYANKILFTCLCEKGHREYFLNNKGLYCVICRNKGSKD